MQSIDQTQRAEMIAKTIASAAGAVAAVLTVGACNAHADPLPFPDISSYAPVNPSDYLISYDTPGIRSSDTYFLTPDGIVCTMKAVSGAACAGNNLPSLPPADATPGGAPRVNSIGTDGPVHPSGGFLGTSHTVHDQPIKTLPPLHSISLGGVICGVDDAKTTACKDAQGRGFILSPSWSGWLPHV